MYSSFSSSWDHTEDIHKSLKWDTIQPANRKNLPASDDNLLLKEALPWMKENKDKPFFALLAPQGRE